MRNANPMVRSHRAGGEGTGFRAERCGEVHDRGDGGQRIRSAHDEPRQAPPRGTLMTFEKRMHDDGGQVSKRADARAMTIGSGRTGPSTPAAIATSPPTFQITPQAPVSRQSPSARQERRSFARAFADDERHDHDVEDRAGQEAQLIDDQTGRGESTLAILVIRSTAGDLSPEVGRDPAITGRARPTDGPLILFNRPFVESICWPTKCNSQFGHVPSGFQFRLAPAPLGARSRTGRDPVAGFGHRRQHGRVLRRSRPVTPSSARFRGNRIGWYESAALAAASLDPSRSGTGRSESPFEHVRRRRALYRSGQY